MPISDKTRKILWGKSGNRCAICKHELVIDSTYIDDESVVGDECHIVSAQNNGPRHDASYPPKEIDNYRNLLLLCRVHHKMVDDQQETFTAEILQKMKDNHEKWVANKLTDGDRPKPLRIRKVKGSKASLLLRLTTGKEVLNLVEGSCAGSYDHDELETQQEVEIVGGFLEVVRDWVDIGSDLGPASRVEAAFELSQTIKELEALGFFVFGAREVHEVMGGYAEHPSDWPVSIIRVARQNSPEIMTLPLEDNNE